MKYQLLEKARVFFNSTIRKLIVAILVTVLLGLTGTSLYYLKKGSSVGRLLIWEVTLGKIADKPVFGHGIGRFEAEYNNWQAEYFKAHKEEMEGPKGMAAGNTKYCFNEYLEMASESGLIGLFLFMGVVILALNGFFKIFRGSGKSNPYEYIPPGVAMISVLVCAFISIPFYSLPTLIIFFMLLAVLSSGEKRLIVDLKIKYHAFLYGFIKILKFLVFCLVTFLVLQFSIGQYKSLYTLDEAVMLYQTGSYKESCKSFSELREPLKYNGLYLQYYGKALNMNQDYRESIEIYKQAKLFTSDEILYTSLGDSYKAIKDYSKAEESYLHASFMVPHKLFPLYLLVKLFDKTGQNENATSLATQILNKKIKVESMATEEIRKEMSGIILNNSKK